MKNIGTLVALCIFFLITSAQTQTLVNQQEVFDIGGPYQGNSLLSFDKDASGNLYVMVSQQIGSNLENYQITKLDNTGNLLWDTTYDITTGRDWGTDIYYYKNYIYATGVTLDSANVCTFNTMKIKESDGSVVWRSTYTPSYSGYAAPAKVRVDAAGNVYVVGTEQTGSLDYGMNLIKYNSSGTMQWKSTYDSTGYYDGGVGLVIGTYISITGFSGSGFGSWDFATATFSPSTGALHDQNRAANGSGAFSRPIDIIKDNEDNLYVLGTSQVSGSNTDLKLIKYDTACHQVWVKVLGDSVLPDVAEDLDYNFFNGKLVITGTANNATGGKDILTAQYDTSGTTDWERRLSNPNPAWETSAKAVIGDWSGGPVQGNVYVAGRQYNGADFDMVTISYDTGGNMRWLKTYNRGAGTNDRATGFFAGGEETLVIGSSEGPTDTLYFAAMYKELEKKIEVTYDTASNPLFMKKRILIRFNEANINTDLLMDNERQFFSPAQILDSIAFHVLDSIAPFSLDEATFVRLSSITPNDTLLLSRLGTEVKIPALWAAFALDYSASDVNEINFADAVSNLFPYVIYAHPDYAGKKTAGANDSLYAAQQISVHYISPFDSASINIEPAWDLVNGREDIRVGVLDDGLDYMHPDLGGGQGIKVKSGKDYTRSGVSIFASPFGRGDHGTKCGGIIGAYRNNSKGIAGIAGGDMQSGNPGVSMYGYRIFPYDSLTFVSYIHGAIVDNAVLSLNSAGDKLNIMSNSWGIGPFKSPSIFKDTVIELLRDAVHVANRCASVFVASRGNEGDTLVEYPACYYDGWVLSVGASGNNGKTAVVNNTGNNPVLGAFNTSFGKDMDVIAPGSINIVTTTQTGGGYKAFNGSSAAAPHVAGVAALLLSYYNDTTYSLSNLTPEDVEHIIEVTATDKGAAGYDDSSGHGLLNAGAALYYVHKPERSIRHYFSDQGGSKYNTKESSNVPVYLAETVQNVNGIWINKGNYHADVYFAEHVVRYNLNPNEIIVDYWTDASLSTLLLPPDQDNVISSLEYVIPVAWNLFGDAYLAGYYYALKDTNNNFVAWYPGDSVYSLNYANLSISVLIEDTTLVTSVKEVPESGSLKIFPTLTSTYNYIEADFNSPQHVTIGLFDITGRKVADVYSGMVTDNKLKLTHSIKELTQGMYFYRLQTAKYKATVKVIKM